MRALDRSLRLPEGEFFDVAAAKSGLAIHHTVGGSASSTFRWWLDDRTETGTRRRVGTAYLIERDGAIHEVFPPEAWAYQFGLPWATDSKTAFEKRFIGIELASLGPLIEDGGDYFCFDRVDPQTRVKNPDVFDYGKPWRGYRYWTRYPKPQVEALIELMNDLLDRFGIPRSVPADFLKFYGEALSDFEGVIGHTMVRTDKTDPNPDLAFWKQVVDGCGLSPVPVGETPPTPQGEKMTDAERHALSKHNAKQLDALHPAMAGLVVSLLDEVERRGTHIRLKDPLANGNRVGYELVEGAADLVALAARSLGFKSWSGGQLEAHGG